MYNYKFSFKFDQQFRITMTTKIFTFLFVLTLVACKEENKDLSDNSPTQKLNQYISDLYNMGFTGSILVARDGEKLIAKGIGKSDEENNIDATPNTIFDIGSITKQFTAAGVLKLEMQGKLSVNDPLSTYFDNVPEDKSDISLHHLLIHSSGLTGAIGDDYDAITEEAFVSQAFQTPLLFSVGSAYEYSNVGYSLLAIIIEKVSGQGYEEFLSEHLFQPAGMHQTGYVIPAWDTARIAVGYKNGRAWGKPNSKNWAGDGPYLHLKGNGGILSTTEDLYKWHWALLGEEILSSEAKKKYYGKHIREGADADSFYGYGWAIFPTPRNTDLVAHNGGNGIFFADFWRYLEEDITIIVMTNSSTRYSGEIAMQIAGTLLVPDFQPGLPSENEAALSTADMNDIVMRTVVTIQEGTPRSWEEFIRANCSDEFINMAPMETHLTYFNRFKQRLNEGRVKSIINEGDALRVIISSGDEEINLIIGIGRDKSQAFKIAGLQLD